MDYSAKEVPFIGQDGNKVEMAFNDFYFFVTAEPESEVPPAPSGLKMTVLPLGSTLVPVLNWKGLNTIWAYSFIDNRMAFFQIVMFDHENNIVKQWYKPGAWYIEEVVLDAGAGKASFVGQAGNLVDLMFSEIEEFCSEKESTVEAPTSSAPIMNASVSIATCGLIIIMIFVM